jgi:aminopeptidase N
MVVPRDDDGQWILHDPWFYGEYLVYPLADFEITLKIENVPDSYLIAASNTPSNVENDSHIYFHKNARNFVWSISPSFQFSQEKIDGITVTSYYFPFHQAAGEQVLKEVINAIRLYSDLFGAYPRSNLSIVEADFLDGMEYDGLFFLSKGFYNLYDGTSKGYLTTIAVHETAHQWWYALIANDQALEPWVDEALCTYSEFLYYESAYPELIDWWWQYRVDFYEPDGKINLPIYDYHGFLPYRDSTYLRGAKFFHDLRTRMGDEKFFLFLKEYVATNKNKISSGNDIWESITKISPKDFNDLKTEYFNKESQ